MKNVKENKNITKTREVVLKYFRFDNRLQRKDALQDAETLHNNNSCICKPIWKLRLI
jgi:hypothetical protein